jgi:hypothetical protein
VVCPQLKISSDRFRGRERMMLRQTASQFVYSLMGAVTGLSNGNSGSAGKAVTPTQVASASHEKKVSEKR